MARKILHLDLDAFFCAVEEHHRPELRGVAFAVGGRPDERGVVASCSYAARRYGIHSAMSMARAVRLCPDLVIVPARHGVYSEVSRQVMDLVGDVTPQVEQLSIDEAFLGVTHIPEPAEDQARRLQARIREELRLPSSLGVATNKLVAKIANDVGKVAARSDQPPNAITVVPPGEEASFLAPLPVEALWGVGPKSAARLAGMGVHTIGDLARWPEDDLVRRFGKIGHDLARRAKGIDTREIVTERVVKSISKETTFSEDVRDAATLHAALGRLSGGVGRRLQEKRRMASTVRLKIRWPDFTTLTRQTTLEEPTDREEEILQAARALLDGVWRAGRPVRLLGVGVTGLGPPIRQLSLWDQLPSAQDAEADGLDRRLEEAIETLQARYGARVIHRGPDRSHRDR